MARTTKRACVLVVTLVAICASLADVGTASAVAAPQLELSSSSPDYVTPGRGLVMFVNALNVGDAPMSGNLTFKLVLPEQIKVRQVRQGPGGQEFPPCERTGQVEECVLDVTGVPVDREVRFKVWAEVEPEASGQLSGQIEVSGAGATSGASEPFTMSTEPAGPFGVKALSIALMGSQGAAVTQAGSDPAEQSTDISFLSEARDNLNIPSPNLTPSATPESYRDVVVHLPAGLVGNPTATPARCAPWQLTTPIPPLAIPQCPLASQVGVVQLYGSGDIVPLYNMQPPPGHPAALGFFYLNVVVLLQAQLRPSDDGVDIVAVKVSSSIPIPKFKVTLWGVPGESSHDPLRGRCLQGGLGNDGEECSMGQGERSSVPFLRLPTSCTGEPLSWSVEADTYQHPGTWHQKSTTSPAVEGCENVSFAPRFALAPSTLAPHSPGGADVTLSMSQDAGPEGVAPADVKAVSVVLPAGVSLNPASANGLQACTDAQLRFKEEGAAQCPDASKVGSLTLKTKLLDHEIGGSIFLLSQKSSDPASGELFRIAVEVRSDQDGVDIKLPGKIEVNPSTGQITTVFEDLPQLPFEAMTLHFEGGAHPVLVTPEACGTYTTNARLTGWNGKTAQQNAPFTLRQECAARGFAPGFTAGATNPVAGAFTQFALQATRTDSDQEVASLSSLKLPPGLLADVGSVARCTDAQAAAAACPEASRLGNVTVGSGAGATPVYITDGNVYLTGPYKGAPFGLAFVIHAQAGPFDLGMVVVRAALNIDPHTAQVDVRTDPLPTIVKGVPVRLRDLRVSIDRPHFTLNPTNCQTMAVNGTATSTQGASAALSSRFQVGECRSLGFKPKFTASTSSKSSRKEGASLHVVIKSASGQANIAKVDVQVPKALSVRDSTLNHACTEAQFAVNPAGCPAGSFVGTATAHTPILGKPLAGPAIFVSHGGAKFPDLDIVLQGEGVTIVLTGNTFVTKGRLLSRFETVPDAPVSRFDLTMPRGPHSALAANGSLCTSKPARLVMPTTIVAQNGAVIHRSTKLSVSGCAKHKARHKKHPRK